MTRWLKTVWRLAIIGCLLLLTGCLQYDLDIQFDSQTHGQLQHRLHWRGAEVATNAEWVQGLQVLRDRTAAVGGTTRFLDEQTLEMTIPFNNGRELETKFNEFFVPQESATPFTLLGGEPVAAQLSLHQNNWFGIIFNHINLRFDLTAVPDLTETRLPLLQGQQLLTGHVQITAPWVRSLTGELLSSAQWALVPGEINDIEADFWVPSPIGMGAAAIAFFVLIGYALKYWLRFGK
ncbi:MAG: DUF3153 domain-containing protein [Leptolyngbya sp. SIOISBB]|nr:DUF3153 domain-containing protein [Leptolyngbya sp. SIOISBB]